MESAAQTSKYDTSRLGYVLLPTDLVRKAPQEALTVLHAINILPLRVEQVTLNDQTTAFMYVGVSDMFAPIPEADIADPDFEVPSYEVSLTDNGQYSASIREEGR